MPSFLPSLSQITKLTKTLTQGVLEGLGGKNEHERARGKGYEKKMRALQAILKSIIRIVLGMYIRYYYILGKRVQRTLWVIANWVKDC